MLSYSEYKRIQALKDIDPELYTIIKKIQTENDNMSSIIAHDILNYIAYLKTSYQLLNKRIPELQENSTWARIENVINDVIEYMSRTGTYRYSLRSYDNDKYPINKVSINNLITELPDYLDEIFDSKAYEAQSTLYSSITYEYNLSDDIPLINANSELLTTVLHEIAKNAIEATICCELQNPIIILESYTTKDSIIISIKNPVNNQADGTDLQSYLEPFTTTKTKHVGLGLSIIHQICLNNNYEFDINNQETLIAATLKIPMN